MPKKLTQQETIEQFKEVHGTRYDYILVEYINNRSKVKIICKEHGIFTQKPSDHKNGVGCSKCATKRRADIFVDTLQTTLIKFKHTHNDRYGYSLVKYINGTTKVKILCYKHGIFTQTPDAHKVGQGCPTCNKVLKSTVNIIQEFKHTHNTLYDYSMVEYINGTTPVKIICQKHGIFEQKPCVHKSGSGCQQCGIEKSFNNISTYKNRTTTLYYVKINELYKIGLTLENIDKRFKKDIDEGISIKMLKTWEFLDGSEAFEKEQYIINKYKRFRYIGENILKAGNSELFVKDVLKIEALEN